MKSKPNLKENVTILRPATTMMYLTNRRSGYDFKF